MVFSRIQNIKRYSVHFSIFTRFTLFILVLLTSSGCQISYYLKSGYHQALLIKNQEPITSLLKSQKLNPTQKNKLLLVLETKQFTEEYLGLKPSQNYSSFVDIQRPYVTYIVQAASKNQLNYYLWKFPIIGEAPYKGFFEKAEAEKEARLLADQNFDVVIRGVRAYSTLGWFQDPILSSMLTYDDDELVTLIIHELTHSTLFIKNSIDFNEQLATFVGNKGAELFFMHKNNQNIVDIIKNKNKDDILFSNFISKQIHLLKNWYSSANNPTDAERNEQFLKIINEFKKLKFNTNTYSHFSEEKLNNAILLGYKTYVYDLSKFETLFKKEGSMKKFISKVKQLEGSTNPEYELEKMSN